MTKNESIQAANTSRFEVDVHLAEYCALRTEIDHYSQRIDRISAVYITAMFAIVGYLVRPDSQFDWALYIEMVQKSTALTSLLLFIPILNSILLIRIGSFFLGVLALSQYTCYTLGPRMTKIIGAEVLRWDGSESPGVKKNWIPIRSLGQILFAIAAESFSVIVLIITFYALTAGLLIGALYILSWIFVLISLYSLMVVARSGNDFHSLDVAASLSAESKKGQIEDSDEIQ